MVPGLLLVSLSFPFFRSYTCIGAVSEVVLGSMTRHCWPVMLCFVFALLFFRVLQVPSRNYYIKAGRGLNPGSYFKCLYISSDFDRHVGRFSNIIFPLVLLALFLLYKSSKVKFSVLSLFFTLAALIAATIDVVNIQLIKGVFLKDAIKINPGENANYYASVIPFLFLCWSGRDRFHRANGGTIF